MPSVACWKGHFAHLHPVKGLESVQYGFSLGGEVIVVDGADEVEGGGRKNFLKERFAVVLRGKGASQEKRGMAFGDGAKVTANAGAYGVVVEIEGF